MRNLYDMLVGIREETVNLKEQGYEGKCSNNRIMINGICQ